METVAIVTDTDSTCSSRVSSFNGSECDGAGAHRSRSASSAGDAASDRSPSDYEEDGSFKHWRLQAAEAGAQASTFGDLIIIFMNTLFKFPGRLGRVARAATSGEALPVIRRRAAA